MRKHLLVLTAVALVATGSAQAATSSSRGGSITVKIETPVFLPATHSCAAGRALTGLTTVSGQATGASMFCIDTAPFDFETQTLAQTGTLTFNLPGGKIVTATTIVDRLATYPFSQSITGTIVGGEGRYAGATGTVAGAGSIFFDLHRGFDPDTTIEIDLD
jgi:hypothetical protein